jgi:hypothetical protein
MGQRLGVGEVVDGHDIERRIAERGPKDVAADAAKTVDAYFDCHDIPP